MRTNLSVGVVAVALLLAGCSTNESTTDSTTAATTTVSASATAATSSPSAVVEPVDATSPKRPTGRPLYEETCAGMKDYFTGAQELAEMMGEAWDVRKAADEFLELIEHPENFPELQELAAESGTSATNDEWDQLSKSDKAQVREAIRAAADGEC